ncbi:MAG: glycine-rich domain-containing protein [Chryseobacterium jejuense]|uniref:glycine-rich domain-containing protein n=1 Tax=Chryseobacterium jejuense TaxID=445960 RepID=UPI003D0CB3AC
MKPEFIPILLNNAQLDYLQSPLWKRISDYQIDQAEVIIPFTRKLAQTEGWTRRFCLLAIEEYKKFVYLCCISKNGASPSIAVDKVWHLHLLYTTEYWKEFCPKILERELHHFPNVGGINEYNKHQDWYLETLKLYINIFRKNPPEPFWRIPKEIELFLLPESENKVKTIRQFTWKKTFEDLHSKVFRYIHGKSVYQ